MNNHDISRNHDDDDKSSGAQQAPVEDQSYANAVRGKPHGNNRHRDSKPKPSKRTRTVVRNQTVAAALSDAHCKEEAVVDVATTKVAETCQAASPVVCANPWAFQGPAVKNYDYVSGLGGVTFAGTVKVGDKKICLTGLIPWWKGGGVVTQASNDMAMLWVVADCGPGLKPILGEYVYGACNERIQHSVVSVLPTFSLYRGFDRNAFVRRVKNHFRRYSPDYMLLDETIGHVLDSVWFTDVLAKRTYVVAMNSVRFQETRLKQHYIFNGGLSRFDREIDCLTRSQVTWSSIGLLLVEFALIAAMGLLSPRVAAMGLSLAPLFMALVSGHYVPSSVYWVVLVSCLLSEMIEPSLSGLGVPISVYLLYRSTRHNRASAIRKLHQRIFPVVNPGIMPCSKATIRTVKISTERREAYGAVGIEAGAVDFVDDGDEVPKYVDIYGSYIAGSAVTYPDQGADNLDAAIRIRMSNPPLYDPVFVRQFIDRSKQFIDKMPEFEIEVEDQLEYLTKKYGAKRGARLYSLIDDPVPDPIVYDMFVKKEAYVGKTEDDFKPRMIWACREELIAKFSQHFNKLGKLLSVYWDGVNTPYHYVCGGTSASLTPIAAAIDACPHIYESDVSNWDGSICRELLGLEMYFLDRKVKNMPEELATLYDRWSELEGQSRVGIRTRFDHGRRSGDLWTSAFNTLLNVLITTYVTEGSLEKMVVLGDDNLYGTSKKLDVIDVMGKYARLGMRCTVIERETVYESTFCSGRFWPVDGAPLWGNCPFRVLMKLGMNHHNHPPHLLKPMLYGTAKGLLPTCGHVPIVGSVLRAICRTALESGITARTDNRLENPYRVQGGQALTPAEDTYANFCNVYGFEDDVVRTTEEWIDKNFSIMHCPVKLDSPFFLQGAEVDGAVGESTITSECENADVTTVPVKEEIEKLKGANSPSQAFASGWLFGAEEDAMLETRHHRWLHALFSTASYFCLSLGIGLHRHYNVWATAHGRPCAAKKKGGRRQAKVPRPRMGTKPGRTRGLAQFGRSLAKRGLIAGGTALGNWLGGPAGGIIGGNLGAGASKLLGMGSYRMIEEGPHRYGSYQPRYNTLSSGLMPPTFETKGEGFVDICHDEYIQNISSTTTFTVTELPINAAVQSTFPWGAGVFQNYEGYQVLGAVFYLVSTSADALNSTNTALGVWGLTAQMDPYATSFVSMMDFENHYHSCVCKPSCSMGMPLECDPRQNVLGMLKTRTGGVPTGADQSFYDHGILCVATDGSQAAAVIGQLRVTYHIRAYRPKMVPGGYATPQYCHYYALAYDNTNNLGTVDGTFTGDLEMTRTAAGTLAFPSTLSSGTFLVVSTWSGASTASLALSYASCVNLTFRSSWNNLTATSAASGSITAARYISCVVIDVTAAGAKIVYSGATLPTTQAYVDVFIAQIATTDSDAVFQKMKKKVRDRAELNELFQQFLTLQDSQRPRPATRPEELKDEWHVM